MGTEIEIGDEIIFKTSKAEARVLAIDDDVLWCKNQFGHWTITTGMVDKKPRTKQQVIWDLEKAVK